MTATTTPITSHIRWPVMKLPGMTPAPWKIHTPPTRTPTRPTAMLTTRTPLRYASEFQNFPTESQAPTLPSPASGGG